MTGLDDLTFTDAETKILTLLSDGEMHSMDELMQVFSYENLEKTTIRHYISKLRKKLVPRGQQILNTTHYRRVYYQQVRLLNGPQS